MKKLILKLTIVTTSVFVFFFCVSPTVLTQNLITNVIDITSPTGQRTIIEILKEVLNWIVLLGLPITGAFLILAGIKFLTAHGDESQIRDAKRMLVYTIVGGAIVLAAFIIVNTIREILIRKGLFI